MKHLLGHSKRLIIGLTLVVSGLTFATTGISSAHAFYGGSCWPPTISASGYYSLTVQGQCFSPGGQVSIDVWDATTQTSPTHGWVSVGNASLNSWSCSGHVCYWLPGGSFSHAVSVPCYDQLYVLAYDWKSGYETGWYGPTGISCPPK